MFQILSTKQLIVIAALAASITSRAGAQQAPQGRGMPGGFGVKPLEETGFQSIFDGKTLNNWDCDTDFWRVEGGAMIGETKPPCRTCLAPRWRLSHGWSRRAGAILRSGSD